MQSKALVILLFATALGPTLVHAATSGRGATIPQMIVRAQAVGVARVDTITDHGQVGMTVELQLDHSIRGRLPGQFKCHLDALSRPSLRPGAAVLVLVGSERPNPPITGEDELFLFGGSRGFLLIEDLVEPGNIGLGAVAYSAIHEAIHGYEPTEAAVPGTLNAEALRPFLRLVASESAELRRWTIDKVLGFEPPITGVGVSLIAGLEDSSPQVAAAAAWHLMRWRFGPADVALRQYLKRLPKDGDWPDMIAQYLAERELEDRIGVLDQGLLDQLNEVVRPMISKTNVARMHLRFKGEDIELTPESFDLSQSTLAALQNHLRSRLNLIENGTELTLEFRVENRELRMRVEKPRTSVETRGPGDEKDLAP